MKDLTGRVAVITGGGGGIGKAMGVRFGQEGMKVVLSDIDEGALDVAVKELKEQSIDATGVPADVSKLESVEALRDRTLESYGAVHVVCNNAGVASGALGNVWDHEDNDWKFALGVHLYGVIHGIQAFVPTLLAQGGEGHVVNTSSHNGGLYPIPTSPTYAVPKAAIVTLSECLWAQLRNAGSQIGVSVLFPSGYTRGILNTGIWETRNRPAELAPQKPRPNKGSSLPDYVRALEAAGQPVVYTPLEEVADQVVQGIWNDQFWMIAAHADTDTKVRERAESIVARKHPDYLLAGGAHAAAAVARNARTE
jgi:NAD(P)-dependent dehydrogenase (short-subunit alcohol dehydrogenase family)